MIVYCHIQNSKAKEAVQFGMKLSEFGTISIKTDGIPQNAIAAYLSPADDKKRYRQQDYECIRIEVSEEKVYIIEGAYINLQSATDLAESVQKAANYIVGTYRNPMALVISSVLPENITRVGDYMDMPVLVESSEQLYLKSMAYDLEQSDPEFIDNALAGYFHLSRDARKIKENDGYMEYLVKGKKYIVKKR